MKSKLLLFPAVLMFAGSGPGFAQERPRGGMSWDVLAQRADANSDGRITREEFKMLSWSEFDQTPGKYWRALADTHRFREAAELIERYLALHPELESGAQRINGANLHFHAAQCLAFAGDIERARQHLASARHEVKALGGLLWNDYLAGTEAFLNRDMARLQSARDALAQGGDVNLPNLAALDRLLANFGQSYRVAYLAPLVEKEPPIPPVQDKQPANLTSALPGPWAEPKAEPDGLKYRTFASKAAGTEVSYAIYLPPDYETAKDRRYPVVYWLHGRGGSQTSAAQLAKRLDPAIRAGKAPPMIVVGVNGLKTSSFVDWADGSVPVQTVIVKELIPHVDETYRTIATRGGRAVEGFSMGGAGAPKLGFKYPELFGAVSIMAGALHDLESYKSRGTAFQDIYGGKADYFEANSPWGLVEKNADAIRGRTTVRIIVGGKDGLLDRNTAYHELLDQLKITHDFTVVPDAPHSPGPLFDGAGDATWAFFKRAFGQQH